MIPIPEVQRAGRGAEPDPMLAAYPPSLLTQARAAQVATLYRSWHRTTASMSLGALILCGVLWEQVAHGVMAAWLAAILVNQAWRGVLARAYRRAQPAAADARRWGATGPSAPPSRGRCGASPPS